jgi:hypothetical protein
MPDKGVHIPDKEVVMPDSPKRRTRVSPELTKARILELCQGTYLTPKELASQLGKNTHYISNNFIYQLVQEGRLRPGFQTERSSLHDSTPMNAYIIAGFRSAVGKAPRGKFRFTRPTT